MAAEGASLTGCDRSARVGHDGTSVRSIDGTDAEHAVGARTPPPSALRVVTRTAAGTEAGSDRWDARVGVEAPLVLRVAHGFTQMPLSPPEMCASLHHPLVFITTRAGIVVHSTDTLSVVERGYAESVDNTMLMTVRTGFRDAIIYALPHAKSGHMSGGMYVFRRGVAGDITLRAAPPGAAIVALESHPLLNAPVVLTNRGQVFVLTMRMTSTFPGPMFPPGYRMLMENREYVEREDEFDSTFTCVCACVCAPPTPLTSESAVCSHACLCSGG